MMRILKSAIAALYLGLVASTAQAAPVTFTVESASASLSGSCTDGFCNVSPAGLSVPGSFTVDTGISQTFNAFSFTSLLSDVNKQNGPNELFNFTVSLALRVGGTVYTYLAAGFVDPWTVSGNGNIANQPVITWTSFTPDVASPFSVLFNPALTVVQGNGKVVTSSVTVGLKASVVPLPAGLVLLLTALLGLVGLSRRRALNRV